MFTHFYIDWSKELKWVINYSNEFYFQKSLANEANRIHSLAVEDGEIQSYLESAFAHELSESVRRLSGHTNDLKNLLASSKQNSLHMYLFDEYLKKIY